jgi:hypothetical protein
VKIVFTTRRMGAIDDIFAVPQSELTPAQLAKSPLAENDIDWDRAPGADQVTATPEAGTALREAVALFRKLAEMVSKSPRAAADLRSWRRHVRLETQAGGFSILIDNGRMELSEGVSAVPDLVFRIHDPAILVAWLHGATAGGRAGSQSPPLTDLVVEGTLILSKPEMETITRLDRIPRSLRRDSIVK